MWYFRNDERAFSTDKFRPKSPFNPRNKDSERLLDIDIPSKRYNNSTRKERDALYSLRDDFTIIMESANKGWVVVLRDREDCLKEAYQQIQVREVF